MACAKATLIFYFCLVFSGFFRALISYTILSHPDRTGPILSGPLQDVCLENICDDLELMELGKCGDKTQIPLPLRGLRKLRIHFERILEAAELATRRLHLGPNSMFAALLLSDEKYVQWLELFRSLEYLIDGRTMVGSHTILQENIDYHCSERQMQNSTS
ncbi:unnamed protein product [Calicophoron daubneyi]|uniref:Uncharacterized protein n=1 Tax=Calicophoron daubneyi TaxID=300641 RepID=A0AAV2T130_CALDB